MVVITHDLGKYHTLKEAELVLSYLQFTKTAAGWIKDKSAARITHLPATGRLLVQEVVPA